MPGTLDVIADKLYDQADKLHNIARQLVYKTRNGAAQPIIPDWYPVIGAIVAVLNNVDDILGHIPDPDISHGDYYDDRGRDADPQVASVEATSALRDARAHLTQLNRELNAAWSAVGHLGVRANDGSADQ